ncbi:MAG: leucine-rich repeat domain-containing protein, partial [Oscillospiraceae bacterium]|nr:leucine-rich repeat domain-containing protein [Oscillospiraceae bacterium]
MKKLVSVLTSLAIVLSVLAVPTVPVAAVSDSPDVGIMTFESAVTAATTTTTAKEYPKQVGDWLVSLAEDGKTYNLMGYFGTVTDITVPSEIDGVKVTEYSPFLVRNVIFTSVVLPEGLLTIGAGAFSGNTVLKSVNIPDSVTKIGSDAFRNTTQLKSIKIGKGLKELGTAAFGGM